MVPLPHWHAKGTTFSSVIAYRTNPRVRGARKVLFGLRTQQEPPMDGGQTAFAELVSSLRPDISIDLLTAVTGGRWQTAGVLSDFQPDVPWGNAVRFRPGNTSKQLTLPALGRWRDRLYTNLQRDKQLSKAPLRTIAPGEPPERA